MKFDPLEYHPPKCMCEVRRYGSTVISQCPFPASFIDLETKVQVCRQHEHEISLGVIPKIHTQGEWDGQH